MKKAVDRKADIAEKQRDYDIIVMGATGFTGRRTAHELINNYSSTYRIGLAAARNKKRLEALATSIGLPTKDCFTVDTTDAERVRSSPTHSLNRKYSRTLCAIWGIRYRCLRAAWYSLYRHYWRG